MSRLPRSAATLALILICLPLLAACGQDDDTSDDAGDTALLPMTLAEWLIPVGAPTTTGDPIGVAHLSITPMEPGDNDLTVHLTDLEGAPLDGDLSLTWSPLVPDGATTKADVVPVDDEPATWRVDNLPLDEGWYSFETTVTDASDGIATSTLYALLPDPSVHGGDAIATPGSDADAETLYQRALEAYGGWQTGRWRENLGSGQDVLVVTRYAVDDTNRAEARMESRSVYAGAFRPKPDGTLSPVRHDFGHRIAIGDRWWSLDAGQWSESSGLPVAGFEQRADIYAGATDIQPAGSETIDGVETQAISFYLPPKGGQAEAWFVWWIEPESGNLIRMVMIAQMHFMIWEFHDIDVPLEIEPPAGSSATPAATPAGT